MTLKNIVFRLAAVLALLLAPIGPVLSANLAVPAPLLDVRASYNLLMQSAYAPVPPQRLLDGAQTALQKLADKHHLRVTLPAMKATDDTGNIAQVNAAIQVFAAKTRLPLDDVAYTAISGMATAMGDKWTQFFTPAQLREFDQALDPTKIFGIGVMIQEDLQRKLARATFIVPGGPAENAGLRAGDLFLAVDGHSLANLPVQGVSNRLRGKNGTVVHLTVDRPGVEKPVELTMTRAAITPPTATFKMLPNDVGYIELFTFGETTPDQVAVALQRLDQQGAKAYIIDLRGNGGGFVKSAIDILNYFQSNQTALIVKERGRNPEVVQTQDGPVEHKPIVVLVDGYTASASEITAGALRDNGLAVLVGEKTYGKGVMQTLTTLPGEAGIKITTAHYLTPGNHDINLRGIEPDVKVTENKQAIFGDVSKDAQLRAALDYLQKKIAVRKP